DRAANVRVVPCAADNGQRELRGTIGVEAREAFGQHGARREEHLSFAEGDEPRQRDVAKRAIHLEPSRPRTLLRAGPLVQPVGGRKAVPALRLAVELKTVDRVTVLSDVEEVQLLRLTDSRRRNGEYPDHGSGDRQANETSTHETLPPYFDGNG